MMKLMKLQLIFFTALKLLGFLKVQLAWCPLIKAKRPQKKKKKKKEAYLHLLPCCQRKK
jgi:hypothetical protein